MERTKGVRKWEESEMRVLSQDILAKVFDTLIYRNGSNREENRSLNVVTSRESSSRGCGVLARAASMRAM